MIVQYKLGLSKKRESSLRRDAIRLLFILVTGCKILSTPEESGATHIFSGEARLHALDFWVRYPDYLADELLDQYEKTGNPALLAEVRSIFTNEEPDIRKIPMLRYRFGAYDNIETAISYLSSRKLVKPRKRQSAEKVLEYDFLVFPKAISLVSQIGKAFQQLVWYDNRVRLVVQLSGNRSGNALKKHQHQRWDEYHATPMGQHIPSITDKVRSRFKAIVKGVAA